MSTILPGKEITQNTKQISVLPRKQPSKEIASQGTLDLGIDCQKEIQGVGMGVLTDGTPFLTQRGLARLCGVQNAHIGTIGAQWSEEAQKPRISTIKDLLVSRGVSEITMPYIEVKDKGVTLYAYPDTICVAVLEYYAFEAGANCTEEARKNFRRLAGKALHDFIYAQVGYDPGRSLPEIWRQFHDRVSLTHNAVPRGYFGIFKEIADMIVTLGQRGVPVNSTFVPDISVGKAWSAHWADKRLAFRFGARHTYKHNYPDYFPQAKSNPQEPWCYPESALGEFRRWFRDQYIGEGRFSNYLTTKVKNRELPASFVQLAISAYTDEHGNETLPGPG